MAFTAEAETGRSVEAASVEASPTAGPTLTLTLTLTLNLTLTLTLTLTHDGRCSTHTRDVALYRLGALGLTT